ncbi:helix-turn-helix domain-containing protein [bacterium]|nr:helix-turn-helix domain-containing protein [bacterium]
MNNLYVSVKEACTLLECGRTKIYTYYINQGYLSVKKKLGNRSFFLREDVLQIKSDEDSGNVLTILEEEPIKQSLLVPITQNKETKNTNILKPPSGPEQEQAQDQAMTEYISDLKSQVHDLEVSLEERNHLIDTYKSKILASIPLIEFNENQKALTETQQLLEFSEQRSQGLQDQTLALEDENKVKQKQIEKSLKVALVYKNTLQEESTKLKQISLLQEKYQDLNHTLAQCRFYEFSRKSSLKTELERIMIAIKNLSLSK